MEPTEINKRFKEKKATPGKHSTDSLQNAAKLGTPHVIRKVLQSATRSLNGGDRRWFKGSTREKRLVIGDNAIIIIIIINIIFMGVNMFTCINITTQVTLDVSENKVLGEYLTPTERK